MDDEALRARALAIHRRVLTIDTHDDIPPGFATPRADPGVRGPHQIDLPKMRDGGLDVGFFVVFVGQGDRTPDGYAKARSEAFAGLDAIHRMTETLHPATIGLAYSPADVERIHWSGRLVAVIGVENGFVVGKDLSLVSKYHALGARYITLVHAGHNDIADSATPRDGEPPAEHNGLSAFGHQVVAEMNRVGLMVDISHLSKLAAMDAIAASNAPVIASHSSARAVHDHPRNLDDETLVALKNNGGVAQAVALGRFLKSDPPPATVGDFVNHIDHMVTLIGIDHVGISSDFDGGGGIVGWNDAAETPNVTIELVRRGYTEAEIARLWGGNLLRVWSQVEKSSLASRDTETRRPGVP